MKYAIIDAQLTMQDSQDKQIYWYNQRRRSASVFNKGDLVLLNGSDINWAANGSRK